MAVVPILGDESPAQGYMSLAEALEQRAVEITEKPVADIPSLAVINRSALGVLVLMGDELVGGMQNRIVNSTILLAPQSITELPVSCVERGRWNPAARRFGLGERAYSRLRFQMEEDLRHSLRRERRHRSDQLNVWASVEREAQRLGVRSPTGAMRDAYEHERSRLARIEAALPYVTDAIGLVCIIGGAVAFAEAFGSRAVCRSAWARIVRSAALEADSARPRGDLTRKAEEFLKAVSAATVEAFPSAGLGDDLRFTSPAISGSALVVDGAVLHWSAIAQ